MSSDQTMKNDNHRIIPCTGCHDCGGRCLLKVHVKNGVMIRTQADDGEDPQLRACLRGYAYRQLVYHQDRLRYPMKRVGKRGEGKFERISWDEALDTIAGKLKQVKETSGNSSIFLHSYSGAPGALHNGASMRRLLSMFGGFTTWWGLVSGWAAYISVCAQYGSFTPGNSPEDLIHSKLIIMWGWNPAETIWGTNTSFNLGRAKEAGARVVAVDPRFHDSAAAFADQWIPIRPGTDAAMMAAMAYVMIGEDLCDWHFLDTHTVGFDKYRDYVLGKGNDIPKTPVWAETITGVPAGAIEKLARDYANTRPAALIDGFGPGRSAVGEQFHRCAMTLASMTGNVGISGGSAAGLQQVPLGMSFRLPALPVPKNPVEFGSPRIRNRFDADLRSQTRVHVSRLWDAVLEGRSGGYPSDLKFFYCLCANPLNQFPNVNKGIKALHSLECIVVHELFMTATAKFADILLPVTSLRERNDLYRPWLSGPYYLYGNQAVEPLYECKSDYEIAVELATRLGISGYSEKNEEEWLREFIEKSEDTAEEIKDFEKFKREGIHRVPLKEPIVAFREQIEDPENNPFQTPSGKIEIYFEDLAELNNPKCPPIPEYVENWEGPNDPLRKKYPLQLITPHTKRRTHSNFDNLPWLAELEQQSVWINSKDAVTRGVKDGEQVKVFNDRGTMLIPARVTQRIMPGVVSIPQGAWYSPDEEGVDRGGCANVLCRDEHSPSGAFACNTALVEVEKA
ncbi:molybdopterin-dependent oxidoreductase [Thermodesulfobacteriota bacterium]